jgi:NADPH:quinone reductase-like Zn-dependent oxidoreductase
MACPFSADVLSLQGIYPGFRPAELPAVPGAEGMGKVEEVGVRSQLDRDSEGQMLEFLASSFCTRVPSKKGTTLQVVDFIQKKFLTSNAGRGEATIRNILKRRKRRTSKSDI